MINAVKALRRCAFGAGVSLAIAAASPCDAESAVTYIPQDDVSAVAAGLSPIYTDDEPVRVIDAGAYRVGLFVVGRPRRKPARPPSANGATPVIEGLTLPNVTAIIRIVKGSGMFAAGGRLADPRPIAADDPDLAVIGPGFRSNQIFGADVRPVKRGDIVIVPAGIPHGFSAVEEPLVYEVIRIDAAKTLPLK